VAAARPRPDAWSPGALVYERLLLNQDLTGQVWSVVPTEFAQTCPLWADDPESPLLVPIGVIERRTFDRNWAVAVLVTPTSVGVPVTATAVEQAAWNVLCRADANALTALLAQLAAVADRRRWDIDYWVSLIETMDPPESIAGRLTAAIRSRRPLLHQRCVLWVLREMLVASSAERAARAAWKPERLDDEAVLAHAWFPSTHDRSQPSLKEVLLAVWMLHETFFGVKDAEGSDLDVVVGMTSALGFQFNLPGTWLHVLRRWTRIWSVEDSHTSVRTAPISPTQIRSKFHDAVGTDPDSWIAGVWAMCIRWLLEIDGDLAVTSSESSAFTLPFDFGTIELSDAFRSSFTRHLVGSADSLREAELKLAGDTYTGLGSLSQTDSVACRNTPVIRLDGGRLVPLSLELVAERAASIQRFVLPSRGAVATTLGHMFEAYVADLLHSIDGRFRVVDEAELDTLLGGETRCDALVVDGDKYLAVESSVQTMPRGVAEGNVRTVMQMADRYQRKADQALATLGRLPLLASRLGILPATASNYLVVTEAAVPHTPAFQRALGALRPDRPNRFVCGIGEFEHLIRLGRAGWSVPGAIRQWQDGSDEVQLSTVLHDMGRYHADQEDSDDLLVWLDRLPTATAAQSVQESA